MKTGDQAPKTGNVDLQGFSKVGFVELPFPDFAGDVEVRWRAMNGVLQSIIDSYENPRILDIASGGGHDTLYLLERGYDIECNEFDPVFQQQLREKAGAKGLQPKLHAVDWRDFLTTNEFKDGEFDVLFALGNSFPNYLFEAEERHKALKGFWRVLKPGGTLFFDVRNYDYILSQSDDILRDPEQNFRYSYSNTYMNRIIKGFPVEISPGLVKFLYKHYGNHNWADLDLCPAPAARVLRDITNAVGEGMEIELFYDYRPEKDEDYDFVQFAIRKPVEPMDEVIIHTNRLELNGLFPGAQMLVHLRRLEPTNQMRKSIQFHAILVKPEDGLAVVRPWVGGGQRNAGYRDLKATIGSRPYVEGTPEFEVELTKGQPVNWAGLTFDDEFVLRHEEGGSNTFFSGYRVYAIEVVEPSYDGR